MLKPRIFLTACSFILALVQSSVCWSSHENFYIGLGIGPEAATIKQYSTIAQEGNFAVVNNTILGARSFSGSIFAGYNFDLCRLNPTMANLALGLEANFNGSSLKYQSSNLELLHSNFNYAYYKLRQSFGLSLLPGFYVSDCTLLYARLGYTIRNFVVATTEITIPNINKSISGSRYGLGIEQYFNDCFSLRLDYSFSYYKKTNLLGFDFGSGTGKYTSFVPRTSLLEIGLAYHF